MAVWQWHNTTVDSGGQVGGGTSLALDSSDKVHISYLGITTVDLKYATNSSGSWVLTTVDDDDTATTGYFTSIALDSSDKAHISYQNATTADLEYATNSSGSWALTTILRTSLSSTSITIDSSGQAHVSRGNTNLFYSLGLDYTGSFSAVTSITTSADGAASVYAVDIDGDGDMDVLSASSTDDKIAWYENDGAPDYSFTTTHTITTGANEARSVYAVDIDGDGDMDVWLLM